MFGRQALSLVPLVLLLASMAQPLPIARSAPESPVQPLISQVPGTAVEASGFVYDQYNNYTYVENVDNHVPVLSGDTQVADILVDEYADSAPAYMAVDIANGYVYAAEADLDFISVISGTQLVGNITLGPGPSAIAYDPANGYIYASYNGSVGVISGMSVIATVSTGYYPFSIVYNSFNGFVYVSNSGSDTVSVISGTQNIANVTVKEAPGYVAFDPSDGLTYVGDDGCSCHPPGLSVISDTTLVGVIQTGGQPYGLQYDPSDGYVYAVNGFSGTISVVSGTTDLANITVGPNPSLLSYDPVDQLVYAIVQGTNSIYALSGLSVAGIIGSTDFGNQQSPGINEILCQTGSDSCYVSTASSISVYFLQFALGPPHPQFTTLATLQLNCAGYPLKVYEGYVYWGNFCTDTIQRVSVSGGPVQNVTTIPGASAHSTVQLFGMALSSPWIFWTQQIDYNNGTVGQGALMRATLWGGPPQEMLSLGSGPPVFGV